MIVHEAYMATRSEIIEALQEIVDPELFIDVWTLGLVYDIELTGSFVKITMTFTSIACPAGPQLVSQIKEKVKCLEGVEAVTVEVVFDPPWEPSDDLKAMMGIF
jgi:metal-sulfur cluster biosynthetic enzyme